MGISEGDSWGQLLLPVLLCLTQSSILQQWGREPPSLSLWLPNKILYLWHPAPSPRTKPPLRLKGGRADGSTEAGERRARWWGKRRAACVTGIYFLQWQVACFFQVGRWAFYLLKHSSSRQGKDGSSWRVMCEDHTDAYWNLFLYLTCRRISTAITQTGTRTPVPHVPCITAV